MYRFRLKIQKRFFGEFESPYENGIRKLNVVCIECDSIDYEGYEVELTEERREILKRENIQYDGEYFYGPVEYIVFKKNGFLIYRENILADPYWSLELFNNNDWVIIDQHDKKLDLKGHRDKIGKYSKK